MLLASTLVTIARFDDDRGHRPRVVHRARAIPDPGWHVEVSMQPTSWSAYDCGDCTILAITGEICLGTAPDLLAGFRSVCGARRRIVVDLTGVTFIDSVGLGVLIEAHQRTRTAGGWLRLVCVDPEVLMVLHLTDLDDVFAIDETVEQASAAG
jgi:anti-sigma B factor antagonist